jgi:nucleoside-triphosphatase THEP1
MKIAVIRTSTSGAADATLATLAERLTSRGLRVVGTVQHSNRVKVGRHCDMDVRILPDGPEIRINQQLGEGARGCRLDAGALETAVAAVETAFVKGADVLIINKFGKHEAEGRGFRALIAEAAMQGMPVVCSVNDMSWAALDEFADGLASCLANDVAEIELWLGSSLREKVA